MFLIHCIYKGPTSCDRPKIKLESRILESALKTLYEAHLVFGLVAELNKTDLKHTSMLVLIREYVHTELA